MGIGWHVRLTSKQVFEHPDPVVEFTERDLRKIYKRHPYRAVAIMRLKDGTIIALASAHAKTPAEAGLKAKKRCLNHFHGGVPPGRVRHFTAKDCKDGNKKERKNET